MDSFERAGEISPAREKAWEERGILLEAMGRTEEALESYHRAISKRNPNVRCTPARLWERAEKLRRLKIENYDRLLEANPQDWKTWLERGNYGFN